MSGVGTGVVSRRTGRLLDFEIARDEEEAARVVEEQNAHLDMLDVTSIRWVVARVTFDEESAVA